MTSRLSVTLPVALLLMASLPEAAPAQHHGAMGSGSPAHVGGRLPLRGGGRLIHRGRHSGVYYPYFWWGDDYGPDSWDETQEAPLPPENVISSREPDRPPAALTKPAESLLLEYHEGQWVRIPTGSSVPIGPQQRALAQGSTAAKYASATEPPPPVKLPPAVLVFRDGHQEQVAKYVVQGNILSTNVDYWATGSWTRRISIADLDVPATVKVNAERGGSFRLPTRANEVVVRF